MPQAYRFADLLARDLENQARTKVISATDTGHGTGH